MLISYEQDKCDWLISVLTRDLNFFAVQLTALSRKRFEPCRVELHFFVFWVLSCEEIVYLLCVCVCEYRFLLFSLMAQLVVSLLDLTMDETLNCDFCEVYVMVWWCSFSLSLKTHSRLFMSNLCSSTLWTTLTITMLHADVLILRELKWRLTSESLVLCLFPLMLDRRGWQVWGNNFFLSLQCTMVCAMVITDEYIYIYISMQTEMSLSIWFFSCCRLA